MTVAQEKWIRAPNEVAQRYARAFYAYLADGTALSATLERVCALHSAIAAHKDLRVVLADPRLNRHQAQKFALGLVKGLALGDEIHRLVGVVARQGRLSCLGEILEAVLLLDAQQRGEIRVEVSTAHPLTEEQRGRLCTSLKEAGYDHIVMTERLNPVLIGGMTVRVGSVLFDTSIAGRLTRLQNAMKGAA